MGSHAETNATEIRTLDSEALKTDTQTRQGGAHSDTSAPPDASKSSVSGAEPEQKVNLLQNERGGGQEPPRLRQAVVVIHGMGEQRPVETLNEFSGVITNGEPFFSRPAMLEDAFEARMHVIPRSPSGEPFDSQTDLFEYHWAHMMRGNRLNDLWPTFRRMMFPVTGVVRPAIAIVAALAILAGLVVLSGDFAGAALVEWIPPMERWLTLTIIASAAAVFILTVVWNVPPGLIGLWLVVWAAVYGLVWAFLSIDAIRNLAGAPTLAAIVAGGASSVAIVAYLISRVLPGWLVKSFVDVTRYLDTSPRSYDVRRDIRKGIVDLLDALHASGKYSRIVIVAHSLGSYIAYDAISYLWTVRNEVWTLEREDLAELEQAATDLVERWGRPQRWEVRRKWTALADERARYRKAQRDMWVKLREGGHPWLITDFVSFGSPMNFADRIFTRNRAEFERRIARRELVTCPPVSEDPDTDDPDSPWYRAHPGHHRVLLSWRAPGAPRRRLHEAAPFAIVRWTNLWYPARGYFFGDWFGGPLARLYGPGVEDIRIEHGSGARFIPGYAHAVYLREGRSAVLKARKRAEQERDRDANRGAAGDGRPTARIPQGPVIVPAVLRKTGSFPEAFQRALDLKASNWVPDPAGLPVPANAPGEGATSGVVS